MAETVVAEQRNKEQHLQRGWSASRFFGTVKNRTITWGRPAVPTISAQVMAKRFEHSPRPARCGA